MLLVPVLAPQDVLQYLCSPLQDVLQNLYTPLQDLLQKLSTPLLVVTLQLSSKPGSLLSLI